MSDDHHVVVQLGSALAGGNAVRRLLILVAEQNRAQVHDEHAANGGAADDGQDRDRHDLLAPIDDLRVEVGSPRPGQENGS
jgi:hypothetical protein